MTHAPTPLYRVFSNILAARENCRKSGNEEWARRHEESLKKLVEFLPSGSGIDNGIELDDASKPELLVFRFGFHHMNENGFYDGWTDHKLIVRPSLQFAIDIFITGEDCNEDYLHDLFHNALTAKVWQTSDKKWQIERHTT